MVKLWTSAICLATVLATVTTTAQMPNTTNDATPDVPPPAPAPGPAPAPAPAPAPLPATAPIPPAESASAPVEAPPANATMPTEENADAEAASAPASLKRTNPLVIKGYRFFDSVTGKYFGMRGINYYPRPNAGPLDVNNLDLFTTKYKHIWERDVPQFTALSANAIRLYAVDPLADHTDFMCRLQAEGIYVIVDLGSSCQGCEITADQAPACYPASYKTRGEQIIQNFAKYDNVIAFSGGNEINHRTGGNGPEWNAPCQKKFVRDMRKYIASCPQMRKIPVGLVVADTNRDDNALYYNCRTDPNDQFENAEWYGINVYVQCDNEADPKKAAGFNLLRDSFASYKYSIPTVLTEFGCTSKSFPTINGFEAQRPWHDAKWMNQREYSDFFNGGFAFEYTTENANSKSTSTYPFKGFGPQNYGLGYLSPETCTDVDKANGCKFNPFPNFASLAMAYKSTDTSKEPTLQSFKVPEDRKQRSKCPAKFPPLNKFKWASDSQKSCTCPQIKRYQCPNVKTKQAGAISDKELAALLQESGDAGSLAGSTESESVATPSDSMEEAGDASAEEGSSSNSTEGQADDQQAAKGSSDAVASTAATAVATLAMAAFFLVV